MVTKEERKVNYERYSQGLEACRTSYLLGAGWVKVTPKGENPGCCWKDPVHGDNCYQGYAVTCQARRDENVNQ